ncbi:MAG: DHH family phosphoesterase [Clostridia bacterium]|nr:DHH family phosphoesterase [Clostridia bacterium]
MHDSPAPAETLPLPTVTLGEIADAFPSFGRTLVLTHVNPDGDCIGSAFALADLIEASGGEARVVCPTPLPKRLRFLAGNDEAADRTVLTAGEADGYDTILSVDVASPAQLGDLAFLIPRVRFMIDHHGLGTPFAPHLVDPKASAAGEIVSRLYALLRDRGTVSPLPDTARRLYAAIAADTGSFAFSNTTEETMRTAGELLTEINADAAETGRPDTAEICRSLFGQRTLREFHAQMHAIDGLRFFEDGRLAAVLFTQQMLADWGLTEEDIGDAVDTPRSVEGVLVALSLRQQKADPRAYKVSSRANADVDCAAVCAKFGGGGHVRAAGCTITADTPEEALAVAAAAFGEAIRTWTADHT